LYRQAKEVIGGDSNDKFKAFSDTVRLGLVVVAMKRLMFTVLFVSVFLFVIL
jgi:hypothetical protein